MSSSSLASMVRSLRTRNVFASTLKSTRSRSSPKTLESMRYSMRYSCTLSLDTKELAYLTPLGDAFHHPEVLDVWRDSSSGLSSGYQEFTTVVSPQALSTRTESAQSSTETLVAPRVINVADLKILRLLGSGSFGSVYWVLDKVSTSTLALKVVSKQQLEVDKSGVRMVLEEQKILRMLTNSPWCTSLEASWSDTANFYFLLPAYRLDFELLLEKFGRLSKMAGQFYMAELILALNDIHGRGVIHRDVKAANLLLDSHGHLVLADFGLAKKFDRGPTQDELLTMPYYPFLPTDTPGCPPRHPSELVFATDEHCGSLLESPPESFKPGWSCFGPDRWGAATIGFRMATGRHPWYAKSKGESVKMISSDPLVFQPQDGADDATKDFLYSMLRKNPSERLQAGVATTTHAFFSGLDWTLLEQRALPPPWVPGSEPPDVLFSRPPTFQLGLDHTKNTDPYPGFIFTNERLQTPPSDNDEDTHPDERETPRLKVLDFLDEAYRRNRLLPRSPSDDSIQKWEEVDVDPSPAHTIPPQLTPAPRLVTFPIPPPVAKAGLLARFKQWSRKIRTPKSAKRERLERAMKFPGYN